MKKIRRCLKGEKVCEVNKLFKYGSQTTFTMI